MYGRIDIQCPEFNIREPLCNTGGKIAEIRFSVIFSILRCQLSEFKHPVACAILRPITRAINGMIAFHDAVSWRDRVMFGSKVLRSTNPKPANDNGRAGMTAEVSIPGDLPLTQTEIEVFADLLDDWPVTPANDNEEP